MPAIYDEPLADTSHIPTLLLCELARQQVTVCLSGDAGDELFGGYGLYQRTQQMWSGLRSIPGSLREWLARFLGKAAGQGVEIQSRLGVEPRWLKRVLRLAELLPVASDQSLYRLLISSCRDPQGWLSEPTEPLNSNGADDGWKSFPDLLHKMMYWDFIQYLPDEILVKVDRAAMSVSLETRIPLLNHRLIEFAWSLPIVFKQQRGQGKWLLRQLLYQYLPPSLVERPKQGFAAPIEEWIRGELRPWAEDLLFDGRLGHDGVFQERTVRQKWKEHLSRKRDWGRALWNVLMFQGWVEDQNRQHPCAASEPPAKIHPPSATLERTELALR
jgi:asparagine synthase (glutamine-hydrolysing)